MSKFEVVVVKIDGIRPIDWADTLEIADVADYQCVVPKGKFSPGEEVAYIPEASLLPENIIKEMGLTGKLAGPEKNRVKAIKLRGVLSEGLVYRLPHDLRHTPIGEDVSKVLGITKYEPVVPVCMSGKVLPIGVEYTVGYDIEHLKKYPNMFGEIDLVTVTEKIHGTNVQIGILRDFSHPELFGTKNNIYVASKGLAAQGLVYGSEVDNVYTKMLRSILPQVQRIADSSVDNTYLLGEIYGRGVQDLHYNSDINIRFFDIRLNNSWCSPESKYKYFCGFDLNTVPVLYEGNFNRDIINQILEISSRVGGEDHILEGVVITANDPKLRHPKIGRPIVKLLSDAYLLRSGGTEYN